MRFLVAILLLCLQAIPAAAQQDFDSLCQALAEHVSIDGAEFKPEATAVPANISELQKPVIDSISIPVEIDLATYFDRPELRAIPGLSLQPDVAYIEVNQDSSVYYNGQEISGDIRHYCGTSAAQQDVSVIDEVQPKPKAKPKPKPKPKPAAANKVNVEPAQKKSSVKVFNGPRTVIEARSREVNKPPKDVVVREVLHENKKAIDVEVLDAQNNTDNVDDDGLIEGQYP